MTALAVAAGITIDEILSVSYDGNIATVVYAPPNAVTPTKFQPLTLYLDLRT